MRDISEAIRDHVADLVHENLKLSSTGLLLSEVVREAVLSPGQTASIIGLTKPKINQPVAEGSFPAPVKLCDGAKGWLASEVVKWMRSRPRVEAEAA